MTHLSEDPSGRQPARRAASSKQQLEMIGDAAFERGRAILESGANPSLLESVTATLRKLNSTIGRAVEVGDARALEAATHDLAGLAGSVGARALFEAARGVNTLTRIGAPGEALSQAGQLRDLSVATLREIESRLEPAGRGT